MASPSDRTYFPSLEECLKGDRILLSWKLVASALSDASCDRLDSQAVGEFLRDNHVLGLFKAPTKAFEASTSQSKSEFETKTAAINVTPTPNDQYDIKTIKEDALWLSRNADINEVAALRIVVAEFQSRAQNHLTGRLSAQDLVNLQEAAGVTSAQASSIFATLDTSNLQDAETIWSDFETEVEKRQRIFAHYLSERRYFMMSADYLTTLMLHPQRPHMATTATSEALRKDILKTAYAIDANADMDTQAFNLLLSTYMDILPSCIQRVDAGLRSVLKEGTVVSDDMETQWTVTSLSELTHAMALIFQVVDFSTPAFTSPFVVSRWFQFMGEYGFLDGFTPDNAAVADLILPLRSLICSISVALLNTTRCLAILDQELDLDDKEDAYIVNPDVLEVIHKAILVVVEAELVSVTPVTFSWALILHRMYVSFQERAERRDIAQNQRAQLGFELENQAHGPLGRRNSASSIVSLESTRYDRFLADAALQQDVHLTEMLAKFATDDSRIYEVLLAIAAAAGDGVDSGLRPSLGDRVRSTFLDLFKTSFPAVGYREEPLGALLQIIAGGSQYWDLNEAAVVDADSAVAAYALDDIELLELYFQQAMCRFPLEFTPFSQLCQSLSACLSKDEKSDMVLKLLLKSPTLTFTFPPRFTGYELDQEEEDTNSFVLTQDVPLFTPSSSWRRRFIDDEESFSIPAGTHGRFLTNQGKIAILDHEHSALALMSKRLDVNVSRGEYDSVLGYLEPSEVAEAISLLAYLVRTETLKATARSEGNSALEAGMNVLRESSRALPNNKDIVTVICDTLDTIIQEQSSYTDEATVAVLNSCIQFLHAALAVCPGRVWSYMARSELLTTEVRAGRLSRLTGTSEMISTRFDFLASSMRLLSSLIDSTLESSVQRTVGNKGVGRTNNNDNSWLGISDKVLEQVSLSIAQTTIDILENTVTWRFASEIHRSQLTQEVITILDSLIQYSFSFGDPKGSRALTACLVPAARYIIDSFMSSSSGSLRFQPLLMSLMTAFQLPESTLYQRSKDVVIKATSTVLRFAAVLLKAINFLDQPSTSLETQLFKVVSLLARLCAVRDTYRAPIFALMEALVVSAGKVTTEPPSLLGYLGPQISKSFLEILSRLDKPFNRTAEVVSVWKFLSTIIRNRQQWMANCLLTGKTPRDALQGDGKLSKASSNSILYAAQETLRTISSIPAAEALAVLDFFTSAHNYWPWTILAVDSDQAYLTELRAYVRDLKSASVVARTTPAAACDQARIAAYIAETFSMQLYHLRQMGKVEEFASAVVQDLDYFLRDGVGVAGYNTSLHVNFAKNFESRYSGCSLESFKRTLLAPRDLGPQYYYALDLAERMLNFDSAWAGKKDDGFRHEMRTANLNLSLVDAQIALFHSWEFLLLELSLCLLPKSKRISIAMIQVAEQCLSANQNLQGPEKIFVKLTQARSNLSLMLVQRLADCSMLPKDINSLLVSLWTTIISVESPYDPDQLPYYRTLLKVLYVILRGSHSSKATSTSDGGTEGELAVSTTQTVLNILDRVVAQGFRTLVSLIHDPEANVFPEDVALITAILQACISMPGMDQCQTQILNIMASHDALHVATSLYSWADKLAVNGDPIYGELSLMFLLELSTLPTIAEQLACDGLLGHIVSSSLANHMRRSNVSPFADVVGAQRCYTVWAKAILPLLLNILIVLGTTIAPEVAFVLNQFPTLLESSVQRFEAPGLSRTASRKSGQYVTLLAASEVHSLALLTRVLAALRVNNNRDIPEIKWDAGTLVENVDFWLSRPKVLRERLLPLGQREAEWRGMKPDGAVAAGAQIENKLEEKVVGMLEGLKLVLSDDAE